jgi:hypothetical protein
MLCKPTKIAKGFIMSIQSITFTNMESFISIPTALGKNTTELTDIPTLDILTLHLYLIRKRMNTEIISKWTLEYKQGIIITILLIVSICTRPCEEYIK